MNNINYTCWTWGMSGVKTSVQKALEILNTKDFTDKESKIIIDMFNDIEDKMEGLKEKAWGDSA